MQPDRDVADPELVELARATIQLAATVADAVLQSRLREIAKDVLALARVSAG